MNTVKTRIRDTELSLISDPCLFSPESADRGTVAMLNQIEFSAEQKILDLGCGYGLVGIYAAIRCGDDNIWMIDRDIRAVEVSKENALIHDFDKINILESDGAEVLLELGHKSSFDWILSNPPYHEDFGIARRFIETGYQLLKQDGRLVLVVKRLLWYKNKMNKVFGGVQVISTDGYYVLISEKRSGHIVNDHKKGHSQTTRKHLKKLHKTKKTHHSFCKNGVS